MNDNELLLLGLLRGESRYGYQINEFIETNLGQLTSLKKPTAYATLDRLRRAGHVDIRIERQDPKPARKVYTITEHGVARFWHLLRESLAAVPLLESTTDVGMLFARDLPATEAVALLSRRLEMLDRLIAMHRQVRTGDFTFSVDLGLEQFLHLLVANRDWLAQTIARLSFDIDEAGDARANDDGPRL